MSSLVNSTGPSSSVEALPASSEPKSNSTELFEFACLLRRTSLERSIKTFRLFLDGLPPPAKDGDLRHPKEVIGNEREEGTCACRVSNSNPYYV